MMARHTELKSRVIDFLRSVSVMSIAINSKEWPVSSVVLFVVDDEFNFYFVTRKETMKAKALREDNRISLSVWGHKRMLVQASGVASEVLDEKRIDQIFDDLATSAGAIEDFWPPVLQNSNSDYAVFSIKTTWLRMLDLKIQSIHSDLIYKQLI